MHKSEDLAVKSFNKRVVARDTTLNLGAEIHIENYKSLNRTLS